MAVLQGITAIGTGFQFPAGLSAVSLQFTASGAANSAIFPSLPLITGSGAAITGVVSSFNLPEEMPYPIAHGQVAEVAESHSTMSGVVASGTALAGVHGTSSLQVQEWIAFGYGGPDAVGTSQVTMPYIVARGTAFLGTGATFSAVVLQTDIQGVSTYTNFVFNSFARFNGLTLAAGDSGIYSLVGDDDAGVKIDAHARFGITDFDSSFRTRVERVYMGYRTSGNLVLRVRTDEVNVRDYLVPSNQASGLHGGHVRIGRGVEARYWQFEVRNKEGSDFSLNMVECKPTKLQRRIGGNDA